LSKELSTRKINFLGKKENIKTPIVRQYKYYKINHIYKAQGIKKALCKKESL